MTTPEMLAGRYRRVAALGNGAMGEVWLADDLVLGRRVAIKRLRSDPASGTDAAAVERMLREARTAARLHHRNIVTVFDLVTVDGQPHVIMEFVDGESLAERVRRVGRLPLPEVRALAAQLSAGLEAAHRAEVVHRDVKPANIMLERDGEAKLADFGIARGLGDVALTDTGQMVGTIAYMAPEVARSGTATAASDMWSLGATLYAAVEGRAPHDDGSKPNTTQMLIRLVTEPVPQPQHAGEFGPLLMALLHSDPSCRPTAGEVVRRLALLPATSAATEAPTVEVAAGSRADGSTVALEPEVDVTRRRADLAPTAEPITEQVDESEPTRLRVEAEAEPTRSPDEAPEPPLAAEADADAAAVPSGQAGRPASAGWSKRRGLLIAAGAVIVVGGVVTTALSPGGDSGGKGNTARNTHSNGTSPSTPPPTSTKASPSAVGVKGVVWRVGDAFSLDGRTAYLAPGTEGPIFAVNVATKASTDISVPARRVPFAVVAVSATRALIAAARLNPDGAFDSRGSGSILVLNTQTRRVVGDIRTCAQVTGVAASPPDRAVIFAFGCVQVIDTATDRVVTTIRGTSATPAIPETVVDGRIAFTMNRGAVALLNVRTGRVTRFDDGLKGLREALLSADGKTIYAISPRGILGSRTQRGVLVPVDAAKGSLSTGVVLGFDAHFARLSTDGRTLYTLNADYSRPSATTGSLSAVQLGNRLAVTTVEISGRPFSYLPGPGDDSAWVETDNGLYRVDFRMKQAVICYRGNVGQLTMSRDGAHLWLTTQDTIVLLDARTGKLLDTIDLP